MILEHIPLDHLSSYCRPLILTSPLLQGCGQKELLQAVGVIGAIIMPHNLYLHR